MTPRRRAATMDQFAAVTWREPVHWWKGPCDPLRCPCCLIVLIPLRALPMEVAPVQFALFALLGARCSLPGSSSSSTSPPTVRVRGERVRRVRGGVPPIGISRRRRR